jgi:hypothetical protein
MSNPTERKDMHEVDYSGPCGVSPDEPKAKSALVRGFESPLPQHGLRSTACRHSP